MNTELIANQKVETTLIDGSRIIIESLVQSGADVFVGYPITPANLLYAYAKDRFPMFFPASDEISALQLISGYAASGKLCVTATSFPGFALMIETINMAFMMELPMVIILSQRLGPSTGSATAGAQGDLMLLRGAISGGYSFPVFCPSNFEDCWSLANQALVTSVKLRTPVVLLTSKEMIMTSRSFNMKELPNIKPVKIDSYKKDTPYKSYEAENSMVPYFLPLGNQQHQVRINASTHDEEGVIRKATKGALDNTIRLKNKIEKNIPEYLFYELHDEKTNKLIVTYGITSEVARDAVDKAHKNGEEIAVLIIKTLLPLSPLLMDIILSYKKVFVVEENASGLLKELLFGQIKENKQIKSINKMGSMITTTEILNGVSLILASN